MSTLKYRPALKAKFEIIEVDYAKCPNVFIMSLLTIPLQTIFLQPEELSVKTEGDVLVILAKHETQTETGGSFVSKQFEQRFSLPSGVKPESIISSLGKDGTLKVTAPRATQSIGSFKKTRGSVEEEVYR